MTAKTPWVRERVRNAARFTLLCSVFGVSLLTASTGLRRLHARPLPFEVRLKIDDFARQGPVYNTLFFGSSRIYRHVIPAVFDQEVQKQAQGMMANSYNFAFDGMRPPESFYYARKILAQSPPLKWVFIELCPFHTPLNEQNAQGERTVGWHDLSNTMLIIRQLLSEKSREGKISTINFHLQSLLIRSVNLSGGVDLLRRLQGIESGTLRIPAEWRGHRGYAVNKSAPIEGAKLSKFEAALDRTKTPAFSPRPLPPLMREPLISLINEVRSRGATPIFVVPPTIYPAENLASLRAQGMDAEMISLSDPVRFPELYVATERADYDHLIGDGPRVFTLALAREFAARFHPAKPAPDSASEK